MPRAWIGLLPALWLPPLAWAGDEPPDRPNAAAPRSPSDQYRALLKEYQAAMEDFTKVYRDARTDEERREVFDRKFPRPQRFAVRFLELAEKNPQDPAALDALIWVASFSPSGPEGDRAIHLLAKDHVQSPKLAPLIPRLSQMGIASAQPLYIAALEQSESHEVKGWSSYGLAQASRKAAEGSRGHDADRANEEAEKYFQDVVAKYGDIKTSRGPLGELATRELYVLRNLRIGKPAPEIEGEDIDGKRFKLSDYRGKVVVLAFWGHWSGPCRAMYPHDRALVKKLAERPFVLLGVNSDRDRNALKQVVKDEEITWRSWWDGGNASGPIAAGWNVTNWPTVVLIDQEGTIRHKFAGTSDEEQLDGALESLIKEAEKGKSRP